MSKVLSRKSIFDALKNQKLGFRFGDPKRVDDDSLSVVLPITRETSANRQYITFPETEEVIVTDSGQVDKMNVENTSKENVFLRSGTIFKGKTQERALTRSAVIHPGQKVALTVRCIHASKGIKSGTKVKYGGMTPLHMEQTSYGDGYRPLDQNTYWGNVTAFSCQVKSLTQSSPKLNEGGPSVMNHLVDSPAPVITSDSGPTRGSIRDMSFNSGAIPSGSAGDDLVSNLDDLSKSFDDLLGKIKPIENQVGMALITDTGCQTVEVFDLSDSWKAIHEDSIRRVGSDILNKADKENVFDYKPEKAIGTVTDILSLDFKENKIYEHRPSNGEPHIEITGLTHDDYVGEVVEMNHEVVHLVIIKKKK